MLTRTEELFPPYLLLPRGVRSTAPRAAGRDKLVQTALGPELAVCAAISEREQEHGLSAARETKDQRQIALLDARERALQERHERQNGERYVRWRRPPIRETCIVPFVERVKALAPIARTGSREFGAGHARRGKRASLAIEAWETSYAKTCWKFIWEEYGDSVASKMTSAGDGDFVTFIRAIAEYASGARIEAGFGGSARIAVKWGRRMAAA